MSLIFEHLKIDNINMSSIKLTVLITDALFHTLFQAVTLYYFLLSLHSCIEDDAGRRGCEDMSTPSRRRWSPRLTP